MRIPKISPDLDAGNIRNWLPKKLKPQYEFMKLEEDRTKFLNDTASMINKTNAVAFSGFTAISIFANFNLEAAVGALVSSPFAIYACAKMLAITKKITDKIA